MIIQGGLQQPPLGKYVWEKPSGERRAAFSGSKRIDYIVILGTKSDLKELTTSTRRGHAAKTFQNVDQAMQQYYFLTGTELPPLSAQPQLEDFLDEDSQVALQRGELSLIALGLVLTGYLTYKFIPSKV